MKKSTYLVAAVLGWSLVSLAPAMASDDGAALPGITNGAALNGADFIPAEASAVRLGHGWRLTDKKGMTLYTFARDQQPGKSACAGNCAEVWPPLLASEGAQAKGDWSLILREGGKQQWAFRGRPLYAYANDLKAGDEYGDEVNQQWFTALKPIATPSAVGIHKAAAGHLLTDVTRLTLYTADNDKAGKSNCDIKCAETWRPLEAPWSVRVTPVDWTVIARADGTKQWVFKGKPLYTYINDAHPGEVHGDKVDGRHAVVLQPPPPNPSWVTYQSGDAGMLVADTDGRTLYAHDNNRRRRGGAAFDRPQDWKPVLAGANDQPLGNWSIVEDNGKRQWAFKGMLLYTNLRDQGPGQMNGIRSSDRSFRTIMKSGQPMQGTGA